MECQFDALDISVDMYNINCPNVVTDTGYKACIWVIKLGSY